MERHSRGLYCQFGGDKGFGGGVGCDTWFVEVTDVLAVRLSASSLKVDSQGPDSYSGQLFVGAEPLVVPVSAGYADDRYFQASWASS